MDEVDAVEDGDSNGPELPSLDLGRLEPLSDEAPLLHHQPKHISQHPRLHYGGRATPTPNVNKHLHKLKLARLSHLDDGTKAKVSRSVQTSHVKTWLHAHGYVVKADKLHPAVARVIEEWFSLVDQDGSRTLEHHELLAALKAAQIPCSDATIHEMINLMDMNKDGVIDWDEFEVFMTEEFAAGKSLLAGEYLLPSGTSLNFGVMIGKLKRNKLLRDIMQDPGRRNRWASIASNPNALERELATMQEAVEATSITLEHLKRSEGAGVAGPSPRSQVTAALVRAMDESRRAARAAEPVRSLTEKLRAGVLTPAPELSRRDTAGVMMPAAEQLLSPSPARTPRGRTCPDPIASPLTPACSEGGFSVCSSVETLMQMQLQMHLSAPSGSAAAAAAASDEKDAVAAPDFGASPPGAPRLSAAASAPAPGSGSALSYNVNAMARYLASQQLSCEPPSPPPPPFVAQTGSGPTDWSARQGTRAQAQYKGSCSGAYLPTSSASPAAAGAVYGIDVPTAMLQRGAASLAPAAGMYGGRRASDAPYSGAARSPAAWSEPLPTHTLTRSGSASRLLAPQHLRGGGAPAPARRDRSPSPGPVSPGGHAGSHQPAPEPHYLSTGTISSRAHVRPSKRVISQVGLMARELRAAPGRFSTEPPGLPAAVLAAVRGQWSLHDVGGVAAVAAAAQTERGLSASADGFAAMSRSMSARGVPGTSPPPPPPALLQRHDSLPAAMPAAPRSNSTTLPVLPHTGPSTHIIDSAFATKKAADLAAGAGDSSGATATVPSAAGAPADGAAGPSAGARSPATSLPEASLRAPMRLLAAAAWEAPASPQPPASPRANLSTFPLSPRASWPAKHQSPADSAAAITTSASMPPATQADAASAAIISSSGAGAGASDKALKPTSLGTRNRPGPPYTEGGGGGADGASRQPPVSPARRRAGPGADGSARGPGASAARAAPVRSDAGATAAGTGNNVRGGGTDALAGLHREPAARSRLLSSDDGDSLVGDGYGAAGGAAGGEAGGRQSPPSGAEPRGAGGFSGARGRGRYRAGDGDSGSGMAAMSRRDAAAALSASMLDSLPTRVGGAGTQSWLSNQLSYGAAGGTVSGPVALLDSAGSLSAAPPSPDGRTNDGAGSGRGWGGSPGRTALASRARSPLGNRGDREDAKSDPSWHAAAASLLQLHITQRLEDLVADG